MSGVEIVGLVLGAFPLLISVLEHYGDAVRSVRSLFKSREELALLDAFVKAERAKCLNSIELFLLPILPGAHLHALLKDPSAIKWASLESRYKISDRLGPAEESFFVSLREIQQCLNELQKAVEAQKWLDRLEFSLFASNEHQRVRKRLENANQNLESFVIASRRLGSSREHRRIQRSESLATRTCVSQLHSALSHDPWACGCQKHLIHLELGSLCKTDKDSVKNTVRSETRLRIGIEPKLSNTFVHPRYIIRALDIVLDDEDADDVPASISSQSASIRPGIPSLAPTSSRLNPLATTHNARNRLTKRSKRVQFSAPPSQNSTSTLINLAPPLKHKQMSSICICFRDPGHESHCLGYLGNFSTTRFSVFSLPSHGCQNVTPTRNIVALSDLLSTDIPALPEYAPRRNRQKALQKPLRLASGQILAEGFLDIQNTPWLDQGLNKETVLFFYDTASETRKWLSDPFVRCSFGPSKPPTIRSNDTTSHSKARSSFPYSKVSGLFDLGQLLIELAYNERFEDLFEDEDKESGQITRFTPLLAAQRLVDDLYIKLGPRYGDAVRRCIAGLDIRETNIEDPNFRRKFHQDIVTPLRETHRFFTTPQGSAFAPQK